MLVSTIVLIHLTVQNFSGAIGKPHRQICGVTMNRYGRLTSALR